MYGFREECHHRVCCWLLSEKSLFFCSYLLDDGQDPRLAFFGPVGTDAEVDLVGEGIRLVGGCERKDDILWCSGHVFKHRRCRVRESEVRTIFFFFFFTGKEAVAVCMSSYLFIREDVLLVMWLLICCRRTDAVGADEDILRRECADGD